MPFSTNADLPDSVKDRLSAKEQSQFREVFNSVFAETKDESKAFASANSVVSKEWSTDFEITKVTDEHLVFGWLSVAVNKSGEVIEDSQGDIIEPQELEKAAYDFVLVSREAGDMHERTEGIGKIVESMVFTLEKQQALGIPEGTLPIGWWVGFKIFDEDVWKRVKSGELSAFSIGGRGQREEI
jgi:cation transport regulator ChaB